MKRIVILGFLSLVASFAIAQNQSGDVGAQVAELQTKIDALNAEIDSKELLMNKMIWEYIIETSEKTSKPIKYGDCDEINEKMLCDNVESLGALRDDMNAKYDKVKKIRAAQRGYAKLNDRWLASRAYPKNNPERLKVEGEFKIFFDKLREDKKSGYKEAYDEWKAAEAALSVAVCKYALEQAVAANRILPLDGIKRWSLYAIKNNYAPIRNLSDEITTLKSLKNECYKYQQKIRFAIDDKKIVDDVVIVEESVE